MFIMALNKTYSQDINYAVLNRKNIIYPFGYVRIDSILKKTILINAGINFSFSANKISSAGSKIGFSSMLFEKKYYKTFYSFFLISNFQNNQSFQSTDFSIAFSLGNGFYSKNWYCSASIISGIPIISHILFNIDKEQINRYYGNFSEKGWYNVTGISYFYNISLGYTIKNRTDISIGYMQLINKVKFFQEYVIPSNIGSFSLGVNYRFGKMFNEISNFEK